MIAVIGTGYWGSKVVDTLQHMDKDVELFDIEYDIDKIKSKNVIVATPAKTHFQITKALLQKNKNVLVEKPAFMSMQECRAIEKVCKTKFMSGHILLSSEHFNYIIEHLNFFQHQIHHIECRRLNWGRVQTDISPVTHLAPHDVAVLDIILQKIPEQVDCKPYFINKKSQPDYVVADLTYEDTSVQLQFGWLYNEKIRNIKIFTDQGIFDWKDENNSTNYFANGNVKNNETFSEYVSSLDRQLQVFIDYCEKDIEPLSNFEHTKRVTYIIECMEESLSKGEVIKCLKKF